MRLKLWFVTLHKNLIREAKIHQIPSVMQTGQREGMMTMDKSIEDLVGTGVISSAEKNNKGFTIIELLVVLAVIGVFVSFTYPNISNWIKDREVKKEVGVHGVTFIKEK